MKKTNVNMNVNNNVNYVYFMKITLIDGFIIIWGCRFNFQLKLILISIKNDLKNCFNFVNFV